MLLVALVGVPAGSEGGEVGRAVFEGPVPEAECGPGSSPETGLQGQVPKEDRESGRSQDGYSCNMELVGQYQGVGASWQFAWHDDCAYYDTYSYSAEGVAVIDATKPADPTLTTKLVTPAMLGPWESLKVNAKRGLWPASPRMVRSERVRCSSTSTTWRRTAHSQNCWQASR
ncbi:MAG: hypothetical protein ACRDT6_04315 [Micromonosporaceae bacterium]